MTNRLTVHRLFTFAAVGAAWVMLLLFLRRNGFWVDEFYTLHSIRLGWGEMVIERLDRGHFPGYFALVRLWYSLWPERLFEVALRSMSVVFYLGAVVSFWPLARRVLGEQHGGGRRLVTPAMLVALALFACNGVAIRQASEARMYSVTLFVAVWLTRAWYEVQQNDSGRRWQVALPALSVAGFVISPTTGVLLGSMLLVSLRGKQRDRRLTRTLATALGLSLLVFIPGAIMHLETADRVGISAGKPTVFLAHLSALMPGLQVYDDYYSKDHRSMALLPVALGFTIMAGTVLWRRRRELPAPLGAMTLIVVTPLALILAAYPLVELFDLGIMGPARYFLTLLPMAALAGAWALMQGRRRVWVHGLLTVFLVVSVYLILTVKVEKVRDHLTSYLQPRYKAGDGLVVTPHELADGVELYVPGATVDVAMNRWELDQHKVRALLEPLGSRETVWLIWYRGNDSPVIKVAESLWGPFTCNRPEKPYGTMRIYEFHPQRKI